VKWLLPLLLLYVSGCGKPITTVVSENSRFSPYIAVFDAGMRRYDSFGNGKETRVVFTDRDVGAFGICSRGPLFNEVLFNETAWDSASEVKREWAMLHELGHCVLDRDHEWAAVGGVPKSIMHPNDFSKYAAKRREYMAELFGRIGY
jgi:hypothetical protein